MHCSHGAARNTLPHSLISATTTEVKVASAGSSSEVSSKADPGSAISFPSHTMMASAMQPVATCAKLPMSCTCHSGAAGTASATCSTAEMPDRWVQSQSAHTYVPNLRERDHNGEDYEASHQRREGGEDLS